MSESNTEKVYIETKSMSVHEQEEYDKLVDDAIVNGDSGSFTDRLNELGKKKVELLKEINK